MSEKKLKPDTARLLKVAEDLSALADSVRALCGALADGPMEPEKPKQEKKAPAITLEKVRGVLAEKSYDICEVSMTIFLPRGGQMQSQSRGKAEVGEDGVPHAASAHRRGDRRYPCCAAGLAS